ncbi:YdeI/OmpD-associated family protein [Taibaiella helva]|uniref:YdeI/OmpD-associated family protein n=1 Tax=Taibaiella helva TaxID=2301235 RepID=UPI000E58E83F|nr:YdeI/OmpD-associated family protein [Taibaiella helva]
MDPKAAKGLKRPIQTMPEAVSKVLKAAALMEAYKARPAYQQNDYLGWIARAKLEATREKRLRQMLDELRQGNVYMKMRWDPASSRKR